MTTIIAKVDKFFQQERSGDVSTAHWRGEIIILIHFHFRFNFLDPPRDTNSVLEYPMMPIRSQCHLCKTTSDSNLVEIPLRTATLAALETEIGKFRKIVKSIPLLSIAQPKLQQ